MSTLYAISEEMKGFIASIDNLEEGEELDLSIFEQIQGDFNDKIVGVIKYMRSLEALAEASKQEAKNCTAMANHYTRRAEGMEKYIDRCMKSVNMTELATPIAKISYAPSKSVVILDESIIPKQYFVSKTKEEISKSLIAEALKEGKEVKGAWVDPTPLIKIATIKGK